MMVCFFLLLLLSFLFYGWFAVRTKKEQELLKSKMYADAVLDWEKIQAWYVVEHPKKAFPYHMLLDTGGFVGFDVTVYEDENGKIFLPKELSPAEFVLAVKKLKAHVADFGALSYMGG